MDKVFAYHLYCAIFYVFPTVFVQGSVKKGVAVGPKNFLCDDFKSLNNIFWWYDWGPNLHMIQKYSNCSNLDQYIDTFVPMIWGKWNIPNTHIPSQAAYLLGFNEPNHMKQSNLPADQAAKYWPQIEEISQGRLLVSPSAAPCGAHCHGDTIEWFDKFFKYCNGCRVDYLATHHYNCNADATMTFLRILYERYKKKIWLTEFACPNTASPNKEHKYMKSLLPQLEAAPFVYRYSWYASRIRGEVFVTKAASLLESDTSNLTDLGQFYNRFDTGDQSNKSISIFRNIDAVFRWLWNYITTTF